jgi:hypothetical protein
MMMMMTGKWEHHFLASLISIISFFFLFRNASLKPYKRK